MTPKAESLATVGTKIPKSMQRELLAIANRKGRTVSDLLRPAIYNIIAEEGVGGEESVNYQLTELMIRCHMDLCPVLRSLRTNSKPRDARPPEENGGEEAVNRTRGWVLVPRRP